MFSFHGSHTTIRDMSARSEIPDQTLWKCRLILTFQVCIKHKGLFHEIGCKQSFSRESETGLCDKTSKNECVKIVCDVAT